MNNIILTIGTFDLPHQGHFNLLRRAKALGDFLIVGINTDEFVLKYKKKTPILSLDQRSTIIENSKYVDAVIVNEDSGVTIINKINPKFVVIGSDWLLNEYTKQIEYFDTNKIIYVPRTDEISTTKIIENINKQTKL
jgi:glycerol-3-phosphate cytidylyltransferase